MGAGLLDHDGEDHPLSEINVTPLVDVMLVLLVIFIIVAPLMAQALQVTLPKIEAPPDPETRIVTVAIRADGMLRVGEQEVAWGELRAHLSRHPEVKPETVVRIAADGQVPYERVAEALGEVQGAGVRRIAFATQPGS